MVLEVYHALHASDPRAARKWLTRALPYLQRDHALWVTPPHLAGNTGLSRYVDLGHGPVPEMADDSTYYVDIVRWLLAHPQQTPVGYLEKAQGASVSEAKPCSGGAAGGRECLQTAVDGMELTPAFFAGDRAMRESGFDTSFRFGPYSGSTESYAPVCLNALLYKYERDLAFITATLGDRQSALEWAVIAGDRKADMDTLMWDEEKGMFMDFDYVHARRSAYPYITTFYALWAGVASPGQAKRLEANLPLFERPGGLQTSTVQSGEQWDAPFACAPTNWLAISGLERSGFDADARRLAAKFLGTVENGYKADGTLREKYNAETASSDVSVSAGYKSNVIGFGWTNGVYLRLKQLLATPAAPQP
jgi:alpha,alpha-trehalase